MAVADKVSTVLTWSLQLRYQTGNSRTFLSDGNIDTDNVFALLV